MFLGREMSIANELLLFFENTEKRVLGQKIKAKANVHLYNYVLEKTNHLNCKTIQEMVYVAVYGENDLYCPLGNRRKYVPNKGFNYCGSLKVCKCQSESLSNAWSKSYHNKSDEEKKEIWDKRASNWEESIGVSNPSKLTEVADKRKETINQRYGGAFFNKDKIREMGYNQVLTRVAEYVTPQFTEEEYQGCFRKNFYKWKCVECAEVFDSHVDYGTIPKCPVCYPNSRSEGERQVGEFLESLGVSFITNTSDIIPPLELDIYIPEHNMAIEFNGVYWHSTKHNNDRFYHLNKTLQCNDLGIQLIHIFSDEWENKQEIVKSRLMNCLGKSQVIYGRQTFIDNISTQDASAFMKEHHLRGSATCTMAYGLEYDGKLVAVMTFGKPRYERTAATWELIRFASTATVVGGASKLLKMFINDAQPNRIITYADRSWSQGDLYKKLGFTDITKDKMNVGYWYFRNHTRFHRSNFTKSKLVSQGADPSLTESAIMEEQGFLKCYDCGNLKFELIIT